MKPWLEIGLPKYHNYWSKYLDYDQSFLRECNINPWKKLVLLIPSDITNRLFSVVVPFSVVSIVFYLIHAISAVIRSLCLIADIAVFWENLDSAMLLRYISLLCTECLLLTWYEIWEAYFPTNLIGTPIQQVVMLPFPFWKVTVDELQCHCTDWTLPFPIGYCSLDDNGLVIMTRFWHWMCSIVIDRPPAYIWSVMSPGYFRMHCVIPFAHGPTFCLYRSPAPLFLSCKAWLLNGLGGPAAAWVVAACSRGGVDTSLVSRADPVSRAVVVRCGCLGWI